MRRIIYFILALSMLSSCGARKKNIEREEVEKIEQIEEQDYSLEMDQQIQDSVHSEYIYDVVQRIAESMVIEAVPIQAGMPSSIFLKNDTLIFSNTRIRSKKKEKPKLTKEELKDPIKYEMNRLHCAIKRTAKRNSEAKRLKNKKTAQKENHQDC